MYKALLTDLDGTAVAISSDGSEVTEATRQAVKKVQENGVKIACATGRAWDIAQPVVRALGFRAACIIEGGTRIVDPITGKTLWERAMSNAAADGVFQIFKETGHQGFLFTSQHHLPEKLADAVRIASDLRFMYLLGVSEVFAKKVAGRINAGSEAVAHMTPS